MTKHVSPERAGTELIGTDYIRAIDGAIMVEATCGWFVYSRHASAKRHVDNEITNGVGPEKPGMTELQALEHSMAESPEDISEQYAVEELERLFEPNKTLVSTIEKDGAVFIDGKRWAKTKPKCNLEPSKSRWRDITIFAATFEEQAKKLFLDMAVHAVGYQHSTIARALARKRQCGVRPRTASYKTFDSCGRKLGSRHDGTRGNRRAWSLLHRQIW